MKMEEIVQELMKHADEYAVEAEEQIVTGVEPRRKHKKKRIAKKWLKKYGVKPKVETKKCRKIDVDLNLIVSFCADQNLPLPDELLSMMNMEENKDK